MNVGTLISVVLCLAILTLRFLFSPRRPQRPGNLRWLKTARLLFAAAIALAAIGYTLQRQAHNMDGKTAYEPSWVERIVTALSR